MRRYFVSFIVALVLYLPLLYLLFFYKPTTKEQTQHLPLKISDFTTQKTPPTKEKEPTQPQPAPTPKPQKLPKELHPTPIKDLQKILPEVASKQASKLEDKEANTTIEKPKRKDLVKANPLSVDELNSLFANKPQRLSKEEKKLKDLYGSEYDALSKNQKEYLKENISTIGSITQKYLKFPHLAAKLNMSGKNMVEFYLSPNGDISEIKLIDSSGYTLLDDNSIETVELAHKDYPYPKEKTRVRIYVDYVLN